MVTDVHAVYKCTHFPWSESEMLLKKYPAAETETQQKYPLMYWCLLEMMYSNQYLESYEMSLFNLIFTSLASFKFYALQFAFYSGKSLFF